MSGLCVLLRFPPFARGACHSWQFLAEKFLAEHGRGQEGKEEGEEDWLSIKHGQVGQVLLQILFCARFIIIIIYINFLCLHLCVCVCLCVSVCLCVCGSVFSLRLSRSALFFLLFFLSKN